ncbi:MAG TPA: amidohydrolase family protein [Dehalococcoidia bacterium]|nr:amidohydrolase family protein [Dehalococcoidia bacterium]
MVSAPAATVIEGATLIDGTGSPPQPDTTIVIEGNRIRSVGPRGQAPPPPGARVIDASGKYVLPGFIDMHVHYRDWMPQLLASHGITSAVDLSNDPDWIFAQKEGIANGKIDGPRLFVVGQGMGAPAFLSGVFRHLSSPEDARQKTRELLDMGVDLFKVYTHITPDQLEAVAEVASAAGKPVIGHLNSLDAMEAADNGISAVAHATGIGAAAFTDPERVAQFKVDNEVGLAVDFPYYLMYHAEADRGRLEKVTQKLLDRQVGVEFNFVNIAKGVTPRCEGYEMFDIRLLNRPELQYLPEEFKLRALSYHLWQDLTEEEKQRLNKGLQVMQEFARTFAQAGGRVLVGTDIQAFVIPGISYHRELELLVDAGLSPLEVLTNATRGNAEFLGVADQLGTITPGKLADLIIINGNPLTNISATQNIEAVMQDGRMLDIGYSAHFTNQLPRNVKVEWAGNPTPSIERLLPGVVVEGADTTVIEIQGRGFMRESVVQFDSLGVPAAPVPESRLPGMPYMPLYTRIQAFVPRHLLSRAGTYPITVSNPKPRGGGSNAAYLIVKFR